MKVIKNKEKKFVVIGQFDRKNEVEVFTVDAERHDIACHLAEIRNGWGTFIACDESQVQRLLKIFKVI